jgi:hypothetical protein
VYIGDADRRLVRVLAETVTVNRMYWLVVPRDIRRLAHVRAVVEILRGLAATHRGLLTPGSFPGLTRKPWALLLGLRTGRAVMTIHTSRRHRMSVACRRSDRRGCGHAAVPD